jgi:hypothetical protein
MGDISDVERKDKTGHLRNIIVSANSTTPYTIAPKCAQQPNAQNKVVRVSPEVNFIKFIILILWPFNKLM